MALAAAALFLAAVPGPARADWLVTRDGGRVETRGAWQVRGKLVVFQTAAGTLSSLRLAEVDLDASRQATEAAEKARKAAATVSQQAPAKKAPVLVVTDDKVRHVEPGSEGAPAAPASAVRVTGWDRTTDPNDGHVVITGTILNGAGTEATDITLTVRLLDDSGKTVATSLGLLSSTTLPPGQQSTFRVDFPNVTTYADVKLEPRAILAAPVKPGPEPAPADFLR
jgi:hypothetical protein